jgi:mono/diheme cytochrome c family protein
MGMTRGLAVAIVWTFTAATTFAQQVGHLTDPTTISAGHELFLEKQCAHCHGEDGRGGINLARRDLDPTGVFQSIAEGREKNGLRMPAWRELLTEEQIWQATAYVMSISHQSK